METNKNLLTDKFQRFVCIYKELETVKRHFYDEIMRDAKASLHFDGVSIVNEAFLISEAAIMKEIQKEVTSSVINCVG